MKSSAKNKQRNIRLIIEYDGTNYCGWQIQKNGPTIQESITQALTRITGHKINLIGSSRTDSGVHAKGQTANFLTSSGMKSYQFVRALNDQLPDDITVQNAKEMPVSFNARYNAKGKVYRYTILNSRIPKALNRNFYYFVPYSISLAKMKQAAKYLVGKHDFRAFSSQSFRKENCVRIIHHIRITRKNHYIFVDVRGNGFLYNMVRAIVGTLLWAARGKIKPEDVKAIIESRERKKAGPTAPAKGLCLIKVSYD